MRTLILPRISYLAALFPLFILASCAVGFLDETATIANNKILLVRSEPPSLGYARLLAFSQKFPNFGQYLSQRGQPDFIAESEKADSRILILYYLKESEAIGIRLEENPSQTVEFSGPYPITVNEKRSLRNLASANSE